VSRDRISGSGWLIALALGLVALAGALSLAMPFWGDQALFTVYGRELADGAVLYRDVFDVKQPGIFVFYAVGGLLFGFTEVGIHLFELVYWLGFSVFALVALRPYFTTPWGAPLVPVFTVVVYYLSAGALELTQVEILVAFPILVAWWLIDRTDPGTREGLGRYAAAGLAAAAVILLKHLYLVIVLAFLVYALLRSRRAGTPIADIRRSVIAFSIALAVPLLIVVAYFAVHGQLGRIWWAYFEMAPTAQLTSPRPVNYLIFGARRFLIGHAPLLILAVVGAVHVLRERTRPRLDLVMGMILWGASGAIAFFIQGWPQYKWSLFTVPVGILAVFGMEAFMSMAVGLGRNSLVTGLAAGAGLAVLSYLLGASPENQTWLLVSVVIGAAAGIGVGVFVAPPRASRLMQQVLLLVLGVSVGLTATTPVDKFRSLMEHDFGLSVQDREEFRRSTYGAYRAADEDLEVLRRNSVVPGPLYVFGDPVLLLRANRSQAVPLHGWGTEFYDRRAWEELYSDLRSTSPPYIVVDDRAESNIRHRYPAIMHLITSRYEVWFQGSSGRWYVLG
jgi:hypothetical protein